MTTSSHRSSSKNSFSLRNNRYATPTAKKATSNDKKKQPSSSSSRATVRDPMHEATLKRAFKWQKDLEAIRDDIYLLQVQNAVLLDSLCMAGADV
jgi:hypothetical protein